MTNKRGNNVVDVDFGPWYEVVEIGPETEVQTTEVEELIESPSFIDRQITVNGNLYIIEDGGALPLEISPTSSAAPDMSGISGEVDENAMFRATVDVDREMERSVLYRVFIMIELIGLALILRSVALYFI